MANETLKERLVRVEARLAALENEVKQGQPGKKDWRRAVEEYKGDEDLLSIFREAEKIREADRNAYFKRLAARTKRRK